MSARPILVDMTRLVTRLGHDSPTGIDRVDLAYARHFLNGGLDRLAVAVTRFGSRILPQERLGDLLSAIRDRWREDVRAEDDPVLAGIRRRLGGESAPPRPPPPRSRRRIDWLSVARREWFAANAYRWAPVGEAPRGAVYLHTSHLRLDRPELFAWLDARPDIRPLFFVHDLIPIDWPEYAVPGEAERHRVRMTTVARRAAGVIVNSRDVGERFEAFLAKAGLTCPPVMLAPLGIETPFLETSRTEIGGRPYFVVCSTIEARKNHVLLLQAWRELASRLAEDTPALVIVGRRGWESEAAIDLLDRSPALAGHVIEATGLSTRGLAQLLAGARALLMPSFAEGYGIPVVEALAVGTPVVASDIAVFREIAGPHAALLHPLDGTGWMRMIAALASQPARTLDRSSFAAPTWEAHFGAIETLIAGL